WLLDDLCRLRRSGEAPQLQRRDRRLMPAIGACPSIEQRRELSAKPLDTRVLMIRCNRCVRHESTIDHAAHFFQPCGGIGNDSRRSGRYTRDGGHYHSSSTSVPCALPISGSYSPSPRWRNVADTGGMSTAISPKYLPERKSWLSHKCGSSPAL